MAKCAFVLCDYMLLCHKNYTFLFTLVGGRDLGERRASHSVDIQKKKRNKSVIETFLKTQRVIEVQRKTKTSRTSLKTIYCKYLLNLLLNLL